MRAYVYAILVDGIVRYYGKGSGNRSRAHMRIVRSIARRRAAGEHVRTSHFYNRLTKAWLDGAEIEEVIVADGLSHEDAYAREIAEIAAAPQGQLWNLWAGGEGSSKGYAKSPEQNQKIAESNRMTWADQKLVSEQSNRMKVHWLRPEYRAQHVGRKWTPEMKRALSEKRKAQWADPEFRARMDLANHTPERRAKSSMAAKARWARRKSP